MAGDVLSRRAHGARDTLLVLALGTLAVIAALAWLAEHLIVFAGVALIVGGAFYLGQRRRAQPRQVQPQQARPEEPAAAAAVSAATLPLADYRDEPGAEQRPAGQADRGRLLADPRSGARPLWGPS